MKKSAFIFLVLVIALCAAGCQPAPAPAPTAVPSATPQAEVVLSLSGPGGIKDLTLAELKALPAVEGQAGIKSSTGKITPPSLFKGVLLSDLVKLAGGDDPTLGVQVEAEDGYSMTLSGEQINNGNFIAYDPATGDETQAAERLQAVVAYEMDGQPLDARQDGTLRLVVISEKNNQVTDGHWSIKWVRNIHVKRMAVEWALVLEGGITDQVDRGSFESCSTDKCHGATWKDEKAQTWNGTPLYYLAGRGDDEIKHGDGSFNKELAQKGYSVEVVGKDGSSVSFDIARLIGSRGILLANMVNENPLTDADFPLRLVGTDVGKDESISGVEKIILHFGGQPAAEPTAEPTAAPTESTAPAAPAKLPAGAALMTTGLVNHQAAWTRDQLEDLGKVEIKAEHPKKGMQEYEGVRLNRLLDLAGLKDDAKTIVFTAADGYTAELDLKSVRSCTDCLVSFAEDGTLALAMPGLESGFWVKNITILTIK